jgi:hypothetical protein
MAWVPRGAAAAPKALVAMPAATAKTLIAVGSTIAVRRREGHADGEQPPEGGPARQGEDDAGIAGPQVQLAGDFPEQNQQVRGSQDPGQGWDDRAAAPSSRSTAFSPCLRQVESLPAACCPLLSVWRAHA